MVHACNLSIGGSEAGGPLQVETSLFLCIMRQARQGGKIQACVRISMFVDIGITEVFRY